MARHDHDEDRPRRSWREIDQGRDRASSRQRRSEDRAQEKVERSPVYGQYKSQVSKMFSGGEMPDLLREKLDPTGALRARDDLLKKIKKTATDDRQQWAALVAEFVGKFEMPEDAYLLSDWLDHPRDRVVEKSLVQLEAMANAGHLSAAKCPKSLDQRLRSLEMLGTDPDVQTRAKALREQLRG